MKQNGFRKKLIENNSLHLKNILISIELITKYNKQS